MKSRFKAKNQFFLMFAFCFLFATAKTFAIGCIPDETFSKSVTIPKAGKIKFREDWVYKYENGNFSPAGVKKGYERFNQFGLKIEEANYDLSGNPMAEISYTYDEFGREAQCIGARGTTTFFSKWCYDFNDSAHVLIKTAFNASSKEKYIFHFNESGNIDEEINYDKNGELNYHYKIRYTSFNKPAVLIEYGASGELYEKWEYLYNAENQNIEVREFNSTAELYKKYLNTFDKDGIQKEIITLDKDGNRLEKLVSVYQFY